MAHFDSDYLVSLASLDAVCRDEIIPGGAGDDRDVRARFALRSRDPKVLDAAHRAAFTEFLTAWMARLRHTSKRTCSRRRRRRECGDEQ
jgi:hypothetical protein